MLLQGVALGALSLSVGAWVFSLRRELRRRRVAERHRQAQSRILELLAAGAPLAEVLDAVARGAEREAAGLRCSVQLSAGAGVEAVPDSCWPVPLRASSGQALGALVVAHPAASPPAGAVAAALQEFARLASIAIEKSVAADKLRESEALYRLLTEDISDVTWRTDKELRFTYINPVDERLRGFRADEVIGHHVFEMFTAEGVATVKEVMRRRAEADHQERTRGSVTFEVQHRCKDGRLLWAEVLSKPERNARGEITGYHGVTRETTERRRMQDQVRQLALHDPLTHLANRRLLDDRLALALAASRRSKRYGALMFLDLDNFKPLNDAHGHAAGDLLLVEVARRLQGSVRETDLVARVGGDEFVVLLGDLAAERAAATAQAGMVAEKLRAALAAPYRLSLQGDGEAGATVEHRCAASVGVVVFVDHETSHAEVLKRADAAMYAAKQAGRNLVRFDGGAAAGPTG